MQIKATSKTNSVRSLGNFQVKSGAIRFTDPCYKNDTWCKGSMPAVNGTYSARIGFFRDTYDEHRLRTNIAVITKAVAILRTIETPEQMAVYSDIYTALKRHDKEHGRSIETSYTAVAFPDHAKHIVDELVAFSKPLRGINTWWKEDAWAKNIIEEVVGYVAGKNHECFDLSFQIRMASFSLKCSDKATDQEIHTAETDALIGGLSEAITKKQAIFDSGKPQRTHFLHIKHESLPEFTSFDSEDWQYNDKFDVGVDSGQAGFFDEQWFADYANTQESNEDAWDKTYDSLCALSSGGDDYHNSNNPAKQEGGTFEFGANSYTAHGDGSAPMFYITNEKGEVIEAVYHYDVDCEECEDEECEDEE